MTAFGHFASALRSALALLVLLVGAAVIVVVRTGGATSSVPAAGAPPDVLRSVAADSLEAAIDAGGSGIAFEVVQSNTLYAKPDGPRIELRSPDDPATVIGVVDEYGVNAILSRGGITADAFWMEMSIARGEPVDFSTAELFARVLERDDRLWRDDGAGWYLTDQSPGVGMDPVTARALTGVLRSLAGVTALEPATFDGRLLQGIRGTSTPEAYPGVIAADGAAFTQKAFAVDCWFDELGRLVRLEATARNLNQDTYDLVATTVVTFTYGSPGNPPDPIPTMAPEVLPTSEPDAAEVQS